LAVLEHCPDISLEPLMATALVQWTSSAQSDKLKIKTNKTNSQTTTTTTTAITTTSTTTTATTTTSTTNS
jgi:hypothetical protein